jgi:hypothetical protein
LAIASAILAKPAASARRMLPIERVIGGLAIGIRRSNGSASQPPRCSLGSTDTDTPTFLRISATIVSVELSSRYSLTSRYLWRRLWILDQQRLFERNLVEVKTFACPVDHNELTLFAQANQRMVPNALSIVDALAATGDESA